jgi:hypothetical protein
MIGGRVCIDLWILGREAQMRAHSRPAVGNTNRPGSPPTPQDRALSAMQPPVDLATYYRPAEGRLFLHGEHTLIASAKPSNVLNDVEHLRGSAHISAVFPSAQPILD